MTRERHPIEEASRTSSIIDRLPSPASLWFLGLLSLPAILFDRFVLFEPFALLFLFGLWPVVGWVVPGLGDETSEDPTEWIDFGGHKYERRAAASSMLLLGQPSVLLASVRQLLGMVVVVVRSRGNPPGPDEFELATTYRLPFDGEWTVVNGSPDRRHSHSWSVYAQRYAYDWLC